VISKLSPGSLNYVRVMLLVVGSTLLMFFVFMLCRLSLVLLSFGPEIATQHDEMQRALMVASRFDIAFIFRLNLLSVLLAVTALPLGQKYVGLHRSIWLVARFWASFIVLVGVALSVTNIVYIRFFGRPFDSFVFHGLGYGAGKTLDSVTSLGDFPVAVGALLILSIFVIWASLIGFGLIERYTQNMLASKRRFWVLFMASLIIYLSLGRGTLTTFPLSQKHLIASSMSAVNNLVPNGLVAIYYGYQDFRRSKDFDLASDGQGRKLFEEFYGVPPGPSSLFSQFFTQTRKSERLKADPPDVVLNLVESLGQGLLLERFNAFAPLAGALAPHLQQDYYFQNFLPAHNDTQKSVLSLLINSEHSEISYSSHQYIKLETSAAQIFKRSGYRTIFIYAGFEGTKNRSDYFKRQGFDEFIGARQLKKLYPEMEMSVWGGDDKYVYDQAIERLKYGRVDSKPLLIVTLSVTNHPPYKMPGHVDEKTPLSSKALASRLGALPMASMETFRYTNDQLGYFLARIKESALSEKTIVVATGDHAVRGLEYTEQEALHQISVPLYFYLPKRFEPEVAEGATDSVASHKDLMPTLYHLALSDARYPNLGRNLFAKTDLRGPHNFAYHSDYLVVGDRVYGLVGPKGQRAFWRRQGLDMISGPVAESSVNYERAEQYSKILDWLTRYQLVGSDIVPKS
jgi:phosphoglycerol transferase MdoB-like AlkP superfamily enzyme